MYVDPRWLATPIGAVIGLAIARKTLRPEDRTMRNLIIGSGLGAGAGFLAGQFIRGNPLLFGKITDDRYRRYVRNVKPMGDVAYSEINALDSLMKGRGEKGILGISPTGGGLIEQWKRHFAKRKGVKGHVEQSVGHTGRIQEYNRLLAGTYIGKKEREKITFARDENTKLKSKHESSLGRQGGLGGGQLAAWDVLKDFFASVIR